MPKFRFKAMEDLLNRSKIPVELDSIKTSVYFGINVFNDKTMQSYLSKEAYKEVKSSSEEGTKLDRKIANQIATGMKAWAMDRGATHYTHWFQPLNGATAEKHDACPSKAKNHGDKSMPFFAICPQDDSHKKHGDADVNFAQERKRNQHIIAPPFFFSKRVNSPG